MWQLKYEGELDVTVECDECGEILDAEQPTSRPVIKVKPCKVCLKEAATDAVDDYKNSQE